MTRFTHKPHNSSCTNCGFQYRRESCLIIPLHTQQNCHWPSKVQQQHERYKNGNTTHHPFQVSKQPEYYHSFRTQNSCKDPKINPCRWGVSVEATVIYINAALLQPYAIHHAFLKSLTKPDLLQEVIKFIGDESFADDSTIKQT